jgi:hypothetical protein
MKTIVYLITLLAAVQSSHSAISFSGTAMQSANTNVIASTSVGVLISLDSGSDWSNIAQVTPGTAFTTGSEFTINTTTFTVFGRNTATALRSVPGNAANFSFTGAMSGNDQFAILLFPNAAQANSVSAGTSLTLWRSSNWALPAVDNSGSTFNFAASGGAFTTVLNSAAATESFTVVPEPSTYALLGLAGLALAGYAVRRRRA